MQTEKQNNPFIQDEVAAVIEMDHHQPNIICTPTDANGITPQTFLANKGKCCCNGNNIGAKLLSLIPILTWLPKYDWRGNLLSDMIAGATVTLMHIPQG